MVLILNITNGYFISLIQDIHMKILQVEVHLDEIERKSKIKFRIYIRTSSPWGMVKI